MPRDESWDRLHQQPRFRPKYPSEAVIRFMMRHLGEAPPNVPRRVLDLGAGAGRHSVLVSELGHRPVALDYSIVGLRHAREALVGRLLAPLVMQARMDALPLADETVDAAIAYGVLYYSDRAGVTATLRELSRVLKPGGRLLVVTRTTRDGRYGRGVEIGRHTFLRQDNSTNEMGMPACFLERSDVDELFSAFAEVQVGWQEFTANDGEIVNSDWVIDAGKPR